MANALLIVPPFIKYTAGPLLGPSLLKAAAVSAGHSCNVMDLNALWIPNQSAGARRSPFVGDHDKRSKALSMLEAHFYQEFILPAVNTDMRSTQLGFLSHADVQNGAAHLAKSTFGSWARGLMQQHEQQHECPLVVGLSLLHAGQVIPAAGISRLAKVLWPEALIAWGGPHIAGIGVDALRRDLNERAFAADIFVTGHAEQSFVDLLDMVKDGKSLARTPIHLQATRGASVAPVFDDLSSYDDPVTLPAQSMLGCSYGKCAYCTYPAMEPTPSKLPLLVAVDSVVAQAQARDGLVSIKDSLVTPRRLEEIGSCISNRVQWSACTKLNQKLNGPLLQKLQSQGLTTLEVGLESLLPDTQRRISKLHKPNQYEDLLVNVASTRNLSLVVNYMTGFPWEDPAEAEAARVKAESLLMQYLGSARGKLEHNTFELERASPMAQNPNKFGMEEKALRYWPWASVIDHISVN